MSMDGKGGSWIAGRGVKGRYLKEKFSPEILGHATTHWLPPKW
jgi:hypothetical protein